MNDDTIFGFCFTASYRTRIFVALSNDWSPHPPSQKSWLRAIQQSVMDIHSDVSLMEWVHEYHHNLYLTQPIR